MDVVSYRIHACILGLVGCLVMSILGLCFAKCGFRNEKYAVLYNGKFRCRVVTDQRLYIWKCRCLALKCERAWLEKRSLFVPWEMCMSGHDGFVH
jgi:hypothetical protein